MSARPLPDQDTLKLLLEYDPQSGALLWRVRPSDMFSCERVQTSWNVRYAGARALTTVSEKGYLYGVIGGQHVRAHRVIWKMMTGREPEVVDHINGCPSDNRWVNLRATTFRGNSRNMKRRVNNRSGRSGVSLVASGRWKASIRGENGRAIHLGRFDTFEEAAAARTIAERALGYHPNHGRSEPVKHGRVIVSIG